MRSPCLRLMYSWWRGEASRRALAQSCAWRGAVARGRSSRAARSLRALGRVIGVDIGRVIFMGRSLVRSVRGRQDGVDDFFGGDWICIQQGRHWVGGVRVLPVGGKV